MNRGYYINVHDKKKMQPYTDTYKYTKTLSLYTLRHCFDENIYRTNHMNEIRLTNKHVIGKTTIIYVGWYSH